MSMNTDPQDVTPSTIPPGWNVDLNPPPKKKRRGLILVVSGGVLFMAIIVWYALSSMSTNAILDEMMSGLDEGWSEAAAWERTAMCSDFEDDMGSTHEDLIDDMTFEVEWAWETTDPDEQAQRLRDAYPKDENFKKVNGDEYTTREGSPVSEDINEAGDTVMDHIQGLCR